MKSLTVLVPVSHAIEPQVEESLKALERKGATVVRRYGFSAIDQARCVLAQEAFDAGFENILWIDSDVAFRVEDVEKLLSHNLDFVVGAYSVKGWPAFTSRFVDDEIVFGEGGGLYEVNYAATGFMLCKRNVYSRVQRHYRMKKVGVWGDQFWVYPYFFPIIKNAEYLGEDYAFCERARQAGIKIYCDTTIKLSHIGKYGYSFGMFNNSFQEPKTIVYNQRKTGKAYG